MDRKTAFTLIELLIVVAIIGILAAIAVPNFQCALIRARVARVKAELRMISDAMESFRIDNAKYPILFHTYDNGYENCTGTTQALCASVTVPGDAEVHFLNEPVDYLGFCPVDPFNPNAGGCTRGVVSGNYQLGSNGTGFYILNSFGPDKFDGNSRLDSERGGEPLREDLYTGATLMDTSGPATIGARSRLIDLAYEASNGCHSRGDIFRTGP